MFPAGTAHTPVGRARTSIAAVFMALFGMLAVLGACSGDDPATVESTTAAAATSTTPSPSSTTTVTTTAPTTSGPTTATGSSSRTTVTYAGPTTTQPGAPVMSPALAESNALARELKATLTSVNELISAHEAAGSPPDDPRIAQIFALRALGQALTARRAIVDGQLPLADEAVRECQKLLLRAAPRDDPTATAIEQAKALLGQMPAPSQAPDDAASYLDEIIRTLRPLVPSGDTG